MFPLVHLLIISRYNYSSFFFSLYYLSIYFRLSFHRGIFKEFLRFDIRKDIFFTLFILCFYFYDMIILLFFISLYYLFIYLSIYFRLSFHQGIFAIRYQEKYIFHFHPFFLLYLYIRFYLFI